MRADNGEGKRQVDARVAGVIVTFNRKHLLRKAVRALMEQSRKVAEVIVVDNASSDGSAALMGEEFPSATYIRFPENRGPGAALGHGMEVALEHGSDWVWMLNDDSFPMADALENLFKDLSAAGDPRVGVVCSRDTRDRTVHSGVLWRRGRPHIVTAEPSASREPLDVDIVNLAGALVAAEVFRTVGVPRDDYFLMWEDSEYSLRIRRGGFRILSSPNSFIDHLYAGSGSAEGWSPPWRGYYQTRNHLHFVLHEERSLSAAWFWTIRTMKLLAAILLFGDRKIERLRLRLRGAVDAVRGRMGKTLDPLADAQAGPEVPSHP